MTSDDFASIALGLADASESAGAGRREFKVEGELFAALAHPCDGFGLLELTADERLVIMAAVPSVFARATGEGARSGSTLVRLEPSDAAKDAMARRAMELAYESARVRSRAIDRSDGIRRN